MPSLSAARRGLSGACLGQQLELRLETATAAHLRGDPRSCLAPLVDRDNGGCVALLQRAQLADQELGENLVMG